MECYVRKHDKLVRHLDMCIEEVSREYARVTMPITENHKNGMGVAHGGAIFSLADVAFGCAANAGNDHGVVSLSTTIEYLPRYGQPPQGRSPSGAQRRPRAHLRRQRL